METVKNFNDDEFIQWYSHYRNLDDCVEFYIYVVDRYNRILSDKRDKKLSDLLGE